MIRHAVALLAIAAYGCGSTSEPDPDEELSAGPFTVFEAGENAFGHPVPGLDEDTERAFFRGRALFRDDWVAAPASTQTRDGLGPLFNARSCEACHVADGRGRPPVGDETELGPMLVRLSVGDGPEPTYGGQFQPFAVPGVPAEGGVVVTYEEVPGTYGDGTPYSLRRPTYTFADLGYGPMAPETVVSPRIPPVMIGLGLLAAIDDDVLAAAADPGDANGDGISGTRGIGRFGLTAQQGTIAHQVTAAFAGDIGLTSAEFPADDCTAAQTACRDAINGGEPEVLQVIADDITLYSELLGVPARRDWKSEAVQRGKQQFDDIGCAACHTPLVTTGSAGLAILANVEIRPYTDLLLHDMGTDLAAGSPEWRTPPLWGIGLTQVVSKHELLLHDGRARGFAEAILWHGGESEAARERFRNLSEADRNDLLAFLSSL